MLLQAFFLSGEVSEISLYDQKTGNYTPGYGVRVSVLDTDNDEKYQCEISEGLTGLDELKQYRKQGQPANVLQQAAANITAQLPGKMTPMRLNVKRIKASKAGGYVTLVCGVVAIG